MYLIVTPTDQSSSFPSSASSSLRQLDRYCGSFFGYPAPATQIQ